MARAREGDLDTRAQAQTAYRAYLLRECVSRTLGIFDALDSVVEEGRDPTDPASLITLPEMSIEEEAGSILEAEMADDLSRLRRYYETTHKA